MIGYSPEVDKKFCDLFCYACEGYMHGGCILTQTGQPMKFLMALHLGRGAIFDNHEPIESLWTKNKVLTTAIVKCKGFPEYAVRKGTITVPEFSH